MKKVFFIVAMSIATISQAQDKKTEQPKDTTVAVTLNINQFRALLIAIDANIDSKKTSKEILEFLQQNARIVNPTIDWNKKAEEAKSSQNEKPKTKN